MKRILRICFPALCLLLASAAFGQVQPLLNPPSGNFTYDETAIVRVSFGGIGTAITIRKDDNSGNITGWQWTDTGIKNPAAYPSGSKAEIMGKFKTCTNWENIWIRGENAAGQVILKAKKLEMLGGEPTYTSQPTETPFPVNQIQYIENFEIHWKQSNAENAPAADWKPAGVSSNPVYVTWKAPLVLVKVFHTLLHLGCKNANGLTTTDPLQVINTMYPEFTDLAVKRVDGFGPLQYWGNQASNDPDHFFTVEELLALGDGKCNAWALAFNDMIRIQGITGSQKQGLAWKLDLALDPPELTQLDNDIDNFFGQEAGQVSFYSEDNALIFVNNWAVNDATPFYINATLPAQIILQNGNALNGANLTGTAAQGNSEPNSIFLNHALTRYGTNLLYDPSYGTGPFPSGLNEWETPSLSFFGSDGVFMWIYDVPPFFFKIPVPILWKYQLNNGTPQTIYTP